VSQFHSLRQRVARLLYRGPTTPPPSQIPWDELSKERQSGWLADADMVIPVIIEACARVADQRDPDKPANYLIKREHVASVMKGLFVGHPDNEDEWECPISYPGCTEDCGNYGCGN
jgi:hypothetical protein